MLPSTHNFISQLHTVLQAEQLMYPYWISLKAKLFTSFIFSMYRALGYVVYRTVLQYYSGETDEDAFDMRKALPRDVDKK